MRWDSKVPRERIIILESVVDQILGVSEETIALTGDKWLKDECPGFFTEADIREFACSLPFRDNWSSIHVTNALLNAIDIVNRAHSAIGTTEEVFTDYELQLMRQEFIERLIKRLNKYNRGYKLAIKEWDADHAVDLVGFRWE